MAAGAFRADLYFRLQVITIDLLPLRQRPEDVEALARHFLEGFAAECGRPELRFAEAALARLRQHSWPGNVRELRNAVERAVLLAQGPWIAAEDVVLGASALAAGWRPGLPAGGLALREVERAVVQEALERCGFVQKDAASLLQISRRKLNYMIQRMGITHPSWRRNRGDGTSGQVAG